MLRRFRYARNRWLQTFKALRALFGPAAAMRSLEKEQDDECHQCHGTGMVPLDIMRDTDCPACS